jgi:VIT1/CCC1 family predicted Fe2+/Mn2+ transporter
MPTTPHIERHFAATETVRDIVIGMADGLTVPFALAAGLAGAVDSTHLIITAGLAEVAAGAIAMGLGGYLAARTEAEHFAGERSREERETHELPETEAAEVAQVFRAYDLPEETVTAVVNTIRSDRQRWVDFMIRFELGMTEPNPSRAQQSALTIGLSYAVGGLVPLVPYFVSHSVQAAFLGSVLVTLIALFVFGVIKGRFTTNRPVRSGWQTVLVGGVAAAAAFTLARMIEQCHAELSG